MLTAIPLSGHTKILHTPLGMGSTAFVAAIALPRYGDLNFSQEINEVLNFFFKLHVFVCRVSTLLSSLKITRKTIFVNHTSSS